MLARRCLHDLDDVQELAGARATGDRGHQNDRRAGIRGFVTGLEEATEGLQFRKRGRIAEPCDGGACGDGDVLCRRQGSGASDSTELAGALGDVHSHATRVGQLATNVVVDSRVRRVGALDRLVDGVVGGADAHESLVLL